MRNDGGKATADAGGARGAGATHGRPSGETQNAPPPAPDAAAGGTTGEGSMEKNVQAAAELRAIMQTTHGLQSRSGSANEVQRQKSPTTPPRQTIHGDLVRRDTATYGVLVGRETIALTPVEGYFTATPHTDTPKKYKKPKSGSDKKQNLLDPTKDAGYPSHD